MRVTHQARNKKSKELVTQATPLLPWAAGLVLLALFAVAVAMSRSSGENQPGPGVQQYRPVTVEGRPLPAYRESGRDQAVGMEAPTVRGSTFSGEDVTIGPDGRPKVVIFLTHSCPHCQADVRAVQSWLDSEGMPEGVVLYAVSTWTDDAKPNFPPSRWLERERWSVTTLADDRGSSAAAAYGLTFTPMYVFVDRDGTVRGRYVGELPTEGLEQAIEILR